uniref:Uncharacterized protein n=1 Tax=Eutreptiella gymnastica TaxID=73025 RepID=A0A7S1J486_9EUGL|mmetsp:Transcript_65888/g.117181  ORF Transcript_65888/g.117181 Transcript_65888/m.117181 type:complete len:963 (+) Transcript_65888:142-3030(+)
MDRADSVEASNLAPRTTSMPSAPGPHPTGHTTCHQSSPALLSSAGERPPKGPSPSLPRLSAHPPKPSTASSGGSRPQRLRSPQPDREELGFMTESDTGHRQSSSERPSPARQSPEAEHWSSPIIYYEVALQELTRDPLRPPDSKRLAECMRLYDEIASRLPKWHRCFTLLRTELMASILSTTVTRQNPLGRVPYFELLSKGMKELATLKRWTQQEGPEAKLKEAHGELEALQAQVKELKTDAQRSAELRQELAQVRKDLETCKTEYRNRKIEWEAQLARQREESLAQQRRIDKLQKAVEKSGEYAAAYQMKKMAVSSRTQDMHGEESQTQTIIRLQEQLEQMQNRLLEKYETDRGNHPAPEVYALRSKFVRDCKVLMEEYHELEVQRRIHTEWPFLARGLTSSPTPPPTATAGARAGPAAGSQPSTHVRPGGGATAPPASVHVRSSIPGSAAPSTPLPAPKPLVVTAHNPLWRDLVAPLLDVGNSKFCATLSVEGVLPGGSTVTIAKVSTVDPTATYNLDTDAQQGGNPPPFSHLQIKYAQPNYAMVHPVGPIHEEGAHARRRPEGLSILRTSAEYSDLWKVWESYERCLAPYLARAPRTISLEDTETLVYEALQSHAQRCWHLFQEHHLQRLVGSDPAAPAPDEDDAGPGQPLRAETLQQSLRLMLEERYHLPELSIKVLFELLSSCVLRAPESHNLALFLRALLEEEDYADAHLNALALRVLEKVWPRDAAAKDVPTVVKCLWPSAAPLDNLSEQLLRFALGPTPDPFATPEPSSASSSDQGPSPSPSASPSPGPGPSISPGPVANGSSRLAGLRPPILSPALTQASKTTRGSPSKQSFGSPSKRSSGSPGKKAGSDPAISLDQARKWLLSILKDGTEWHLDEARTRLMEDGEGADGIRTVATFDEFLITVRHTHLDPTRLLQRFLQAQQYHNQKAALPIEPLARLVAALQWEDLWWKLA